MRLVSIFLASLLVLPGASAQAQGSRLNESCDVAIFGGWDAAGFLAFDQELRAALKGKDIAALSLLVDFPLRVNAGGEGSFSIVNPAALQARFDEVFPAAVRAAVLEQHQENFFCNWSGLHYDQGRVWVGVVGHRYAVMSVNLPRQPAKETTQTTVTFACDAERHRFVIETAGKQEIRLHGWTKPRPLREEPDILASGSVDYEGTGLCAYPIWTFESGEVTYVLSGIGCFSDTDAPPQGARGRLHIKGPSDKRQFSWCY